MYWNGNFLSIEVHLGDIITNFNFLILIKANVKNDTSFSKMFDKCVVDIYV